MSGNPPSTADYLRFHARHTPGAIALIDNGQEINYATFHHDLGKFTAALRRFGLPPRSFVAVGCDRLYLHWLLLLACENLGLATASFLVQERDALGQLLARIQLVLCTHDLREGRGTKCHVMTQEWFEGVVALPEEAGAGASEAAPLVFADPQRIRRTSGTTGRPKVMVTSRGFEEQRVQSNLWIMGFTPESRLLISTPFTVASTYSFVTACLRLGATCIWDARISAARAIAQYRPSHVRLFPFEIAIVLDELPGDFRKPADLTLKSGAAPLSEVLRQRVLERLASRVIYSYNCNEVGTIAMVGAGGLCTPRPGVQLEIVDDRGAPVPDGQVGEVRVRTTTMVEGYLDDPEATARAFRDGWFHTGDAGMMAAPGQLKLVGRNDEVLNIGGLKVSPAMIEERVQRIVAVEDVGVTSLSNADGIEEVCIVLVLKDGKTLKDCGDRIVKDLPRSYGRVFIKAVDSVPRTPETGKVRRGELKRLFGP